MSERNVPRKAEENWLFVPNVFTTKKKQVAVTNLKSYVNINVFGVIVAQKLYSIQFTSSVHKQNGVQWAMFLFPYFSYN